MSMSTTTPNVSNASNGSLAQRPHQRQVVAPPVDVFENGDELLIIADIPGVAADSVDLRFENDTLTLDARRPPAKGESPALVREFDDLDFQTTFRIPAGIETGAIRAETKNGTLVVHLPKAAAAKPRKIEVR
ncbi:MAG: Hsp20/alpha crystallin family protein [Myxococcales bacterium]|nr:Hsp20/alpha crystallin family protein [Myxococcales bacterium]